MFIVMHQYNSKFLVCEIGLGNKPDPGSGSDNTSSGKSIEKLLMGKITAQGRLFLVNPAN